MSTSLKTAFSETQNTLSIAIKSMKCLGDMRKTQIECGVTAALGHLHAFLTPMLCAVWLLVERSLTQLQSQSAIISNRDTEIKFSQLFAHVTKNILI